MKYTFYFLFIILCGGIFSCKSPTQTIVANKYYYSFSFSVGMQWQFSYLYENQPPGMVYYMVQSGIHKWQVISLSLINQDSIYTVQQIRKDTVHLIHPGENVDTTYIIADTSEFIIQYSYNMFQFKWPSIYFGAVTVNIPNHTYVNAYPVIVSYPSPSYNAYTEYDNNTVPVELMFDEEDLRYIYIEKYSLIDFKKQ